MDPKITPNILILSSHSLLYKKTLRIKYQGELHAGTHLCLLVSRACVR